MTRGNWIELLYVIAVCGFILSLKWMSAAPTARRGLFAGEIGFGVAIIATLMLPGIHGKGFGLIAGALAVADKRLCDKRLQHQPLGQLGRNAA